jgi:phosphate butyryltransferase
MKGHLHTDDFLRGLLDKETGLRSGHIMSHVYILETKPLGRLTLVTDGAMNVAPDLPTKADIVMNAVYLARLLGVQMPKVCCLAAVELINPEMPATLEAAALAKMSDRGQFPECQVDGPFALDNAVSLLAAQTKKINSPCAGQADILLVPDIEAGNILAKSFSFLCGGRVAGVLVGAAAPVVLTSRADSAEAKLYSIATAVYMSDMKRDGRTKIGKVHY